jgi:hypothetical protein
MPRRAAADILPIGEIDRPPPPEGMSAVAATIWRAVVDNMRERWVAPESFAILETYCTLTAEKKRLELEFSKLPVTDPQYERLTARHDKMAAQALAHARSLRLTPRSNVTNREARDPLRGIKKPWELG